MELLLEALRADTRWVPGLFCGREELYAGCTDFGADFLLG